LNILLCRMIKILAVDAAAVLLLNPIHNLLEYTFGIGFRTNAIQRDCVRLGKSLAGRTAVELRVVQIQNAADERGNPFLTDNLKGEDFVSYYGTPLMVKGKMLGVLEVFSRSLNGTEIGWIFSICWQDKPPS
jgi:signal transduction protein with GAF and PtsI domain